MKLLSRNKDPIASLEADLASARKNHERLGRQAEDAQTVHVEARNRRLRMLIDREDAIDAKDLARADSDCRIADDRLEALVGARMMVEDKIAALEKDIAAKREADERERVAAILDQRASEILEAATVLDEVGAQLKAASDRMQEVLQHAGLYDEAQPISYVQMNRAMIVAMLRRAAPVVLPPDASALYGMAPEPVGALDCAARTQVEPLRTWATRIGSGEAPAVMPSTPPLPRIRVNIETTAVVLSESIEWYAENGVAVQANEGGCHIPWPVAEKCIALGIGHPLDSAKGLQIMRELQAGEPSSHGQKHGDGFAPLVRRGPPWRNIGANLYEWVEVERARLEAERSKA